MQQIQIQSDDGVIILGQRGTGKSNLLKAVSYVYPKVVVYDPLMQHGSLGQVVTTLAMLEKALQLDVSRIVFQPEHEGEEAFDGCCRLIYLKGRYSLVADETDLYVTKHVLPYWFGELIKRGRNYGCGYVALARRTAEVNNHAIAFSNHLFIFYHHINSDIEYLREWIGEEWSQRIKHFPRYYFLYYHLEAPNEAIVCLPIPRAT